MQGRTTGRGIQLDENALSGSTCTIRSVEAEVAGCVVSASHEETQAHARGRPMGKKLLRWHRGPPFPLRLGLLQLLFGFNPTSESMRFQIVDCRDKLSREERENSFRSVRPWWYYSIPGETLVIALGT